MKIFIVSLLSIFQTLYAFSLREHHKNSNLVDGRIAVQNIAESLFKDAHDIQPMNIAGGVSFPSSPTYAIFKTYADATCSTVSGTRSTLLNTCMAMSDKSIMYTCSGNSAVQTTYTDISCTTVNETSAFPSGCVDAGTGFTTSAKVVSCGTSNAFDWDGEYLGMTYYQDSTCSSQLLASTGLVAGYCYPSSTGSFIIRWPNIIGYSTSTCTGTAIGTADVSQNGCEALGTADDTDEVTYNAYEAYQHIDTTSSSSDDSLSPGAIAGIVIGGVVFIGIVVGLIGYFVFYKKAQAALLKERNGSTMDCSLFQCLKREYGQEE